MLFNNSTVKEAWGWCDNYINMYRIMEALLWSWRRREFVSGGEFILQNQVTVVLFAMSHLEQLPPSSLPAGRRDHYMLFIDTHEEFGLHFVVPCLCRYGRMDRTLLIPTFTTNVTVSLCPFCLWHSFFDVVVVFVSLSTSPQTSKNTSNEGERLKPEQLERPDQLCE